MKFIAGVVFIFLLALVALFFYGLALEPETRVIEQEAVRQNVE